MSKAPRAEGRPGYHDPTAGLGPPALSALTLRLWLAAFGLVFSVMGAVVSLAMGLAPFAAVLALVAATAVIDIAVVQRRRHRGEPG